MGENEGLSSLDLLILRSMPGASRIEDLAKVAKVAKVPAVTLGKEVATLQVRGYISDKGALTEKGLKAIGKWRRNVD